MLDFTQKSLKLDMAMEILCTLPRQPHAVPLSGIVAEFGLEGQGSVRECFLDLAIRGIEVVVSNKGEMGRCAGVRYRDWPVATALAEKYWQTANS